MKGLYKLQGPDFVGLIRLVLSFPGAASEAGA